MFKNILILLFSSAVVLAGLPIGAIEDPTRPQVVAKPTVKRTISKPMPKLNSILVGDHRRVAVIGGRVYSEGEHHNGIRLVRIDRTEVVVRMDGRSDMTLRLGGNKIHKELK